MVDTAFPSPLVVGKCIPVLAMSVLYNTALELLGPSMVTAPDWRVAGKQQEDMQFHSRQQTERAAGRH